MKTMTRAGLVALAALLLAGLAPHSAWADGDKGKEKKKGPVVVIGPITKTNDPPPKKQ